jgi:hypothetical protein
MTRKIWQRIRDCKSLVGKDQYDWRDNWTRHNIIDEVFMLYQSINEF